MAAFYSGEYKSITITLLNSDGTDYDVTTATGIACIIYEQPEKEIARYSLIAATGYDTLTVQNTNEILLAISEADSAKISNRLIYVAGKIIIGGVAVEFKADVETVTNHPLKNLVVPE